METAGWILILLFTLGVSVFCLIAQRVFQSAYLRGFQLKRRGDVRCAKLAQHFHGDAVCRVESEAAVNGQSQLSAYAQVREVCRQDVPQTALFQRLQSANNAALVKREPRQHSHSLFAERRKVGFFAQRQRHCDKFDVLQIYFFKL